MFIALLAGIQTPQGGPTIPVGPKRPAMTFSDQPVGTGSPVGVGDRVTIHFQVRKGKIELADSKKRGLPYTFEVGSKGSDPMLDVVVRGMRQGGTRRASLTGAAGYGDKGAPPLIQPTDMLTVTIHLLRRSAR